MAWFISSKPTEEASAYTADASVAPDAPIAPEAPVLPADPTPQAEGPEPEPRVTEPVYSGVDPRPFIEWLVEAETVGNRDVYPMPQELQPTVADSEAPLDQPIEEPSQDVTSPAEAHLGDPDSGGQLPE